jgi:mannose-6-phosphate isomerase-like protein (cupin superfamily)
MIKKKTLQAVETREKMRGGAGTVQVRHYLKPDEINAKCRLCAELVLGPGSGIGPHAHEEEDEIFLIQRGKGVVTDNGREVAVESGDAVLTGKGGTHSIRNTGDEDLVVTAVIIQY